MYVSAFQANFFLGFAQCRLFKAGILRLMPSSGESNLSAVDAFIFRPFDKNEVDIS